MFQQRNTKKGKKKTGPSFLRNLNLHKIEKMTYLGLIPSLAVYFGYKLYKTNILEADKRL